VQEFYRFDTAAAGKSIGSRDLVNGAGKKKARLESLAFAKLNNRETRRFGVRRE